MKSKVEDHDDLMKDTATGSVINNNRSAFTRYKKSKNARLADKRKIVSLEDRLAKMESLVERLIDDRD